MLTDSLPIDFQIEEVILLSVFRHKLPGLKRAVVIDVPAAQPPLPPAAFHALSNLAACAASSKADRTRKSFDEYEGVGVDMVCVCF
jgi:hypothetical protein